MIPVEHVVALSTGLFTIGAMGALVRRNLVAVLFSLQLMLDASVVALVGFNRAWWGGEQVGPQAVPLDGQVLALVVVVVGAAQLALGVAVIVALARNRDDLAARSASLLRW